MISIKENIDSSIKNDVDSGIDSGVDVNDYQGKVIYHLHNLAIYKSDLLNDKGNVDEFSIHVTLDDYNKEFWKVFSTKIVPEIHPNGAVPKTVNNVRTGKNIITFRAQSVTPFHKHLNNNGGQLYYQNAEVLVKHAHLAMKNLEENGMEIVNFDVTDFIVINDEYFLFINSEKILFLNEDNQTLSIKEPIEKGTFPSPELESMKSVPFELPKQSGLFSLASFVGSVLTNNRLSTSESGEGYYDEVDKFLFEITDTKLYWCLKRCLNKDPLKRVFLLIE